MEASTQSRKDSEVSPRASALSLPQICNMQKHDVPQDIHQVVQ